MSPLPLREGIKGRGYLFTRTRFQSLQKPLEQPSRSRGQKIRLLFHRFMAVALDAQSGPHVGDARQPKTRIPLSAA
jgi:hypothetical protein